MSKTPEGPQADPFRLVAQVGDDTRPGDRDEQIDETHFRNVAHRAVRETLLHRAPADQEEKLRTDAG
jgi:hypothetical protein